MLRRLLSGALAFSFTFLITGCTGAPAGANAVEQQRTNLPADWDSNGNAGGGGM